jgi:hypothetical protein
MLTDAVSHGLCQVVLIRIQVHGVGFFLIG